MPDDQLRAHLEFFEELGVNGFRRESAWRTRVVETIRPTEPHEHVEPREQESLKPTEPSAPSEPARIFVSQADALSRLRVEIGPD